MRVVHVASCFVIDACWNSFGCNVIELISVVFFFSQGVGVSRSLLPSSWIEHVWVGKATHPSHTEGRTECDHRSVGDNVVHSQNGVRLLGH